MNASGVPSADWRCPPGAAQTPREGGAEHQLATLLGPDVGRGMLWVLDVAVAVSVCV